MPASHVLLTIFVMAIWGFNFVAIKLALVQLTPLALCFFRFLLASLPAIFFVKIPKIPFKMIVLYAMLMFVGQFGLLFTSMKMGLSAGLAALLLQMQLFFTILGAMFLGHKPKPWDIIGALISFSGIAIVGIHTDGSTSFLGFILIIIAAASMGMGNLVPRVLGKIEMVPLVIWSSLVSCPVFLLLYMIFDNPDLTSLNVPDLSLYTILSVLYIVYASTLFGYSVWTWLLSKYPVAMVTPFSLLAPIFAMLSSTFVLGESLEQWKINAGALVIAGICVNIFGSHYWSRTQAKAKTVTAQASA